MGVFNFDYRAGRRQYWFKRAGKWNEEQFGFYVDDQTAIDHITRNYNDVVLLYYHDSDGQRVNLIGGSILNRRR